MGLLVVNSDFERLWNEPYPTISFDNATYSLAGEVGTELSTTFEVIDNNNENVADQCTFTFSNEYVSIEDGSFVCSGLSEGTYETIVTATYDYLSAEVHATATISISVEGEAATSISFDSNSYTMYGSEGDTLTQVFSVSDDLGNDVTSLCSYTFNPDTYGLYVDSYNNFTVDNAEEGQYNVSVSASYGNLTATATITLQVAAVAHLIEFDSATYTMTGDKGDTVSVQFSVSDDLYNDLTADCTYSFSPNDKDVYVDNGYFKVDSAIAGTYDIEATATYNGMTSTATIECDFSEVPTSITFDSNSYTISGTEGDTMTESFTVSDDLNNDITSQCTYTLSPNNTGLTASNGTFDASSVNAGQYSVTITATYGQLTATCTVSMDIASAGPVYSSEYLTFEALESGTFTLTVPAAITSSEMTSVSYSTDNGTTWTDTTIDSTAQTITTPTISQGGKVLWKGTGTKFGSTFSATGNFNASGNAMSLLYGDNFANQTTFSAESALYRLFMNNRNIVSAENMILPATTLTAHCYQQMFSGCSGLTKAPSTLPTTNLGDNRVHDVYNSMFRDCTSLTTAPELPATTLVSKCYNNMFMGCTSLTTAPELPATTLATYCYNNMFRGCTSLTTAPELPATTLDTYCYIGMFYGCTALTTAPELPATTLANNCYGEYTSSTNHSGMFDGCTSLTTAPELPATTLAINCYAAMFLGCTNLNSIAMLATDITASGCLNNWVKNVASSGTFTKDASMTTLPTGNSGIPANWTVVDAS